jgi:hypothetical protein
MPHMLTEDMFKILIAAEKDVRQVDILEYDRAINLANTLKIQKKIC